MYYILKVTEKTFEYIITFFKVLYWKIKYGKRISIGKNIKFRKGLIIEIGKKGYLRIGNNNFFNNYCSINCLDTIIIGNDNLFGENVKIYDHNHIFNDFNANFRKDFKVDKIVIENRNWICSNVVLLSKSSIGSNNVIGAGCVLNKKIKNNTIIKNIQNYTEEEISFVRG